MQTLMFDCKSICIDEGVSAALFTARSGASVKHQSIKRDRAQRSTNNIDSEREGAIIDVFGIMAFCLKTVFQSTHMDTHTHTSNV